MNTITLRIDKEKEETQIEFYERAKSHLDGPELQLKIDTLYDDVFRKYFKHSEILSEEELDKITKDALRESADEIDIPRDVAMYVLEKIKKETLEHFYEDN